MMFSGIPITYYQIHKIKKVSRSLLIIVSIILFSGNLFTIITEKRVIVDKTAYTHRDGFPFFTSHKRYIETLKTYPHNPGTTLSYYRVREGDTLWRVAKTYKLSIDTILAANPCLESMNLKTNTELAIPNEDGVLFTFENILDIYSMKRKLNSLTTIKGDYLPHLFSLISIDDVRFVFFKDAKPALVNPNLEQLYAYRKSFRNPVNKGTSHYTSMFGDRVDPFMHGSSFHNGVDIHGSHGNNIYPFKEGYISYCGWRNGYGKTVVIQHKDGYSSLYAHCSKIKVTKGQWVTTNDVIGLIGSTGRSTGPHVHFTIMRHGKIVDPLIFIW